jgi:hypothetical protein
MTCSGSATGVALSRIDAIELLGVSGCLIVRDGERRRFLNFLAALLGEEVPESLKGGSEGKEILVDFLLLLMILKAADIIEELLKILHQINEYRYCGLGTGGGWNDEAVKKCNAGKR